jgi:hypothetical protein
VKNRKPIRAAAIMRAAGVKDLKKMNEKATRIVSDIAASSVGSRWRAAIRAILLVAVAFGAGLSGEQIAAIGVAVEAIFLAIQGRGNE